LAKHEDGLVRNGLAWNPSTPVEILMELHIEAYFSE